MTEPDVDDHIRLTPSLLRAIEEHKYLRSCESCREVTLAQAAEEFRVRHEDGWRAAKLRVDNTLQMEEMQKHLWIESQKAGRDVGRNRACSDWVSRHAREWRRGRESLRANGFVDLPVVVEPGSELEQSRVRAILRRLAGLFCDVFLSQPGMARPDFLLKLEPDAPDLPFIHVQVERVEALASLDLRPASCLYVVAYGRDAAGAVEALKAASQAALTPARRLARG